MAFKHILRVISGSDYMSDIAVAKDLDEVHRGKPADEDNLTKSVSQNEEVSADEEELTLVSPQKMWVIWKVQDFLFVPPLKKAVLPVNGLISK